MPEPFSWAAALVAVGVEGFDLEGLQGNEAFDTLREPGRGDWDTFWDWDWVWVCDWAGEAARGVEGDLLLPLPDGWPSARAIIAAERVLEYPAGGLDLPDPELVLLLWLPCEAWARDAVMAVGEGNENRRESGLHSKTVAVSCGTFLLSLRFPIGMA